VAVLIVAISRRGAEATSEMRATAYSLIDLSPDGIICATADGRILYANPAIRRMLGVSMRDGIIGKHALDIVHPDSHALVTRRMSETAVGEFAPWMEEKWCREDGSPILVEVAAVTIGDQGRVRRMVYVRDLTARKKAEEALVASNERFHALFENAIDAILIFDNDGQYIDANASAVAALGYSREEILTKRIGDFSLPEERDARLAQVTFDRSSGETVVVRKDGQLREIEYRLDTNVVPGAHCIFFVDVTERKALERTSRQLSASLLESQDEERRRIARQLHETTAQTLAALRMNLMHMENDASPELAKTLLKESIGLTEQGIREVRTLSHLLHPPLIEDLGVVAALRWYIDGFNERSGITVALEAPEDLGRFSDAVENGIFRIVQEALTNIHRHSGTSVARVALTKQGDDLCIVIEDEGKGMPVREPGKPPLRGVGIAAMQERVKELGGRFQIASGEKGTRINVLLHAAWEHR
jgi:PAS domain S-box-containing protein